MNIIWKEEDKELSKYFKKTLERQVLVMKATNNMVVYFVSLGNDLATATNYVEQLSTEVSTYIRTYELGNTQPLKDAINTSSLPFMDAPAKAKAIGDLTI